MSQALYNNFSFQQGRQSKNTDSAILALKLAQQRNLMLRKKNLELYKNKQLKEKELKEKELKEKELKEKELKEKEDAVLNHSSHLENHIILNKTFVTTNNEFIHFF